MVHDITRRVLLSAFRHAASMDGPVPPFVDELKLCARQQFEYMLEADEDAARIAIDEEFRSEVVSSLSTILSAFVSAMASRNRTAAAPAEDVEWVLSTLLKMSLAKDFVLMWHDFSSEIQRAAWGGFRERIVGISGKVLETAGGGEVVVPAGVRAGLLRRWVPFMREVKGRGAVEEETWGRIEGAIASLLIGLPSEDQAGVYRDWMGSSAGGGSFPDMTDAFRIWCYRCKSARRKLRSISTLRS